ncbi:hypothetical protein C4553_03155, partial [Candidatus Parcubacteria bacterium]
MDKSDTSDNSYRIDKKNIPLGYLLVNEAAKFGPYSAEYVSLLARRGKIHAKKFGRNWYTTRQALEGYLNKQGIQIIVPKDAFHSYKGKIRQPIIYQKITQLLNEEFSKDPEPGENLLEFNKSNQEEKINSDNLDSEKINLVAQWNDIEKEEEVLKKQREESSQEISEIELSQETPIVNSPLIESELAVSRPEDIKAILADQPIIKLDYQNLEEEEQKPIQKIDAMKEEQEPIIATEPAPQKTTAEEWLKRIDKRSEENQEAYSEDSVGLSLNWKKLSRVAGVAVIILAIGAFVVWGAKGGGFNKAYNGIKTAFFNLIGKGEPIKEFAKEEPNRPDTPAPVTPQVVIRDDNTGSEIIGVLPPQTPSDDGTTQVVVQRVDVLNSDTLDGLDSRNFTLSFVTNNGNITSDNVKLQGNVEVGKTLTVKGSLQLAQALVASNGINVSGLATFNNGLVVKGDTSLQNLIVNGACIGCGGVSGGGGGGSVVPVSGGIDVSGNVRFDTGSARIFSAYDISGTNAFFGSGDQDDKFEVNANAVFLKDVNILGTLTATFSPTTLSVGSLTVTGQSTLGDLTFNNGTGSILSLTTLKTTNSSTTNLSVSGISGSTQCLQADANGNVSGTGAVCGAGGGGGAP